MLFPVHKRLGIPPNIEQSVIKVLVSQSHYLVAHPPAKQPVSSKRIARLGLGQQLDIGGHLSGCSEVGGHGVLGVASGNIDGRVDTCTPLSDV